MFARVAERVRLVLAWMKRLVPGEGVLMVSKLVLRSLCTKNDITNNFIKRVVIMQHALGCHVEVDCECIS